MDGSVGDALCERAVAGVELRGGCGKRAVRVRVVLEDAAHDFPRDATCRRDHLRPLGFGFRAEVLEYPGGMPGDIGFFLTWK